MQYFDYLTPEETEELLREALVGNSEAFEQLCVGLLPRLNRTVRAMCHRYRVPEDLADDFAQEALLKALESFRNGNYTMRTAGWLGTVAVNAMRDWCRREARKHPFSNELAEAIENVPEDQAKLLDIEDCLSRLSETDQEVLRLVLMDGEAPTDVGARLKIDKWAAYKRFERALRRLREILKE